VIEPYVEQAYFGELCRREVRAQPPSTRLEVLRRQVEAAEYALDRYRDSSRVLNVLGENRYAAGLQARVRALDLAMQAFAAEQRRVEPGASPSCKEAEGAWPTMDVEERRKAIKDTIDCVFIVRGWGKISARATICFRGEQPPDLPVRGARSGGFPKDPEPIPRQRKMQKPRRWPRARIVEELSTFLAGRSDWPPPEEFTMKGHGPLWAQVARSGGPEYWALRMGVHRPRHRQGIRAWDPDLAQQSLREFVRGRTSFPTRDEFTERGFRGLYNWLQKHGGVGRWAGEFGLQVRGPRGRLTSRT